jgi:formylmethanofuran dehydrogenase subunit E
MDKILWETAVKFHSHECPGLAIGFKACERQFQEYILNASPDEIFNFRNQTSPAGEGQIIYHNYL